jgi:RNA polymerase sigma factor (sigma-70 family)
MATCANERFIEHLRRVVLFGHDQAVADRDLLARFVQRRDEAAFEALVRRHGPMVFGVCFRILRHQQDAEDAFQATFLVLARKAAAVRPREMLGNWLFGVAHQTAVRVRSANAKRSRREQPSSVPLETTAAIADNRDELPNMLDQELSRLPDKYRAAIVLCDLEGKTRKEAARQLGWPEGSVAGRLARARELLAKRLTRRGVALSGGAVVGHASLHGATAAVPSALCASTSKAAILFASGQGVTGIVSSKVAALAAGVLKAMLLTNLKSALALTLIAVSLAFGLATLGQMPAVVDDVERELATKRLQGAWAPDLLLTARGAETYPLTGRALIFTNDRFVRLEGKRTVSSGTFRVQDGFLRLNVTERSPWDLEAAAARGKSQYTFKIDGDVLTLCYAVGDSAKADDLTPGEGRLVVVYKRQSAATGLAAVAPKQLDIDAAAAKAEQKKLNGKWTALAAEISGTDLSEDVANMKIWKIDDGRITMISSEFKEITHVEIMTFKIDPAKKPAHIDLKPENAGRNAYAKGIYKLDGDELTVCFNGLDGDRPIQFRSGTKPGGTALLTFKRDNNAQEQVNPPKRSPPAFPFPLPDDAIKLRFGEKIKIDAKSAPVKEGATEFTTISIGVGTFQLDNERLTATLKAAVVQHAKAVYVITATVYDASGSPLGEARHTEKVERIQIPRTLTIFRDINLDFGASKQVQGAAYVVILIREASAPAAPVDKGKAPPKTRQEAFLAGEVRVEFSMTKKPWREVMEWVSDQTGLAFVAAEMPPGTFNFINPKGTTFTFPEVIDIINEGLQPHHYVLIRREKVFSIVAADTASDLVNLPRVEIKDLAKFGKTEIVQILVPLQSLNAKEFAPEVKRQLGPFGSVVALPASNSLIIQDAAGSLRRLAATIEAAEKAAPAQN